jgi:hypothetical protein
MKALATGMLVACGGGPLPDVVLNEVDADKDLGGDWLEIHNTSNEAVDLEGWTIEDVALGVRAAFRFPAGATLEADAYGLVYCAPDAGSVGAEAPWVSDFALDLDDDQVWLIDADGTTVDDIGWTALREEVLARAGDGPDWERQAVGTPGEPNPRNP